MTLDRLALLCGIFLVLSTVWSPLSAVAAIFAVFGARQALADMAP